MSAKNPRNPPVEGAGAGPGLRLYSARIEERRTAGHYLRGRNPGLPDASPFYSMLCYAVLMDGGFVRKKPGSRAAPLTADSIAAFICWLTAHNSLALHRLHRVCFYDAEPMKGKLQIPLQGES